MKKFILFFLFHFFCVSVYLVFAGDEHKRLTPQDYIQRFKDDAIRDMKKTGVPASITLAQGMFESENGNSRLAREANNHFGIKCHKEWTGPTYIKDDDTKDECFRKYASVLDSYDDHSQFLRTRERYNFLFGYEVTDYKKWAHGLKKAGYATNPEYAYKLIKIIEENNLNELDHNREIASISKPEPVTEISKTNPLISAKKPVEFNSNLQLNNEIKCVVARQGDSWLSIARQQEMMLWQVLKYNDADKGSKLEPGQIVYLNPKRNKAKMDYHIVKAGETMHDISQLYGIKLKKLYLRNHITLYVEPEPGTKLSLNKEIR